MGVSNSIMFGHGVSSTVEPFLFINAVPGYILYLINASFYRLESKLNLMEKTSERNTSTQVKKHNTQINKLDWFSLVT